MFCEHLQHETRYNQVLTPILQNKASKAKTKGKTESEDEN